MSWIRQYLISVTAAAMICGLVTGLMGKKGTPAAMARLASGLFLAVTVISPLTGLRLTVSRELLDPFSAEAAAVTAEAQDRAKETRDAIIKERTEAYILDKAASLGLDITARVTLTQDEPPVPWAAELTGTAAPGRRAQLEYTITQDLGIGRERIRWN